MPVVLEHVWAGIPNPTDLPQPPSAFPCHPLCRVSAGTAPSGNATDPVNLVPMLPQADKQTTTVAPKMLVSLDPSTTRCCPVSHGSHLRDVRHQSMLIAKADLLLPVVWTAPSGAKQPNPGNSAPAASMTLKNTKQENMNAHLRRTSLDGNRLACQLALLALRALTVQDEVEMEVEVEVEVGGGVGRGAAIPDMVDNKVAEQVAGILVASLQLIAQDMAVVEDMLTRCCPVNHGPHPRDVRHQSMLILKADLLLPVMWTAPSDAKRPNPGNCTPAASMALKNTRHDNMRAHLR